MVQRFPELQRVDQCLAVSVLFVQLIQTPAGEQERGNPFAITPEPDPAQFTTPAQKIRPSKNVCGLKAVGFQRASPPSGLIFLGRFDRKRKRFQKDTPFWNLPWAINCDPPKSYG